MDFLNKTANRKIGRAMHHYSMLADGDRVLIAVSGGIDSLVLSAVLKHWQSKAPINYDLLAVHIDNGFDQFTGEKVKEELHKIGIPFRLENTDFWQRAANTAGGQNICYHCARLRRNRLFAIAETLNFNKIAFGHHKDDILETFFINLLYAGNISTMVPKQKLFKGSLYIIRPLAYLEKSDIVELADTAGITPVKNPCPKDTDTKRQTARKIVAELCSLNPEIKSNIFTALSNVRKNYLLNPGQKN